MSKSERIPLRALAFQRYGGRDVRAGEEFEVSSEGDAADLVALRFAVRVNGSVSKPDPAPGTYKRRDMRSER
jgi:hypothetical protein